MNHGPLTQRLEIFSGPVVPLRVRIASRASGHAWWLSKGIAWVLALLAGIGQREDTYYYGLCAAPQLDETDTSNNCSAAVELEVGAGGLLPDLAVTATAELYTLYPTVTNVGSLRAEPARLIYYCSPDAVKSPDDVPISPKHTLLPSLAPEEKASYREYFSASQRWPGHPYFYACAEPVAGEKNTDNNCSAVYSMVPIQ